MKFKIGDRVVSCGASCKDMDGKLPVGIHGTIKTFIDHNHNVGVEWDITFPIFHNLFDYNGIKCNPHRGWFVNEKNIKLLEE
jgi:hypothetical protein